MTKFPNTKARFSVWKSLYAEDEHPWLLMDWHFFTVCNGFKFSNQTLRFKTFEELQQVLNTRKEPARSLSVLGCT